MPLKDARKLPLEGQLLGTAFNQDFGCFSAGVASGFRVYNCEPYKEQVGPWECTDRCLGACRAWPQLGSRTGAAAVLAVVR